MSIITTMYKQIAIPFFVIVLIASTGYILYRMDKSKAHHSKTRTVLTLLFLWYLCAVAAITVVPIRASRTQNLDHHFNFVPVVKAYERYVYVHKTNDPQGIPNFRNNFIGNILMFVPLGIFLPLLYKKNFGQTLILAAMASCLIEFLQFLNMYAGYYRFVDIDDVILNTLGAVIGYWILKAFVHAQKNRRI